MEKNTICKRIQELEILWATRGYKIKYLVLGKDVYVALWNRFNIEAQKINVWQVDLESDFFGAFYGYNLLVVSKKGVIEVILDKEVDTIYGKGGILDE